MASEDFDLTLSQAELTEIAPALLASFREFVAYGLCRMANQAERNMSARHYAEMAAAATKQFPQLKLTHMGAKVTITEVATINS